MPDFAIVASVYVIVVIWLASVLTVFVRLGHRVGFDDHVAICFAFVSTGCVGYLSFFVYVFSAPIGTAFSSMLFIATIAAVAIHFTKPVSVLRDAKVALAVSILFGLVYLSCAYLWAPPVAPDLPAVIFFEKARPSDFKLPLEYAQAIYLNTPARTGIGAGDWYFTDRPPLQTGFTLLFSPLWLFVKPTLVYQALGTALQISAIAAVWILCRAFGLRVRETVLAVTTVGASGFLYYNSVYVWPKLLAATFFLCALIPFARAFLGAYRLGLKETVICAAAAALALLSHGAIVYSLVPLAVLAATRMFSVFSVRSIAAGVITVLVLYAPWAGYTHFVDPNNSKLLKMHLTDGDYDSAESFATILVRSYRNITFERWATNRRENIKTLAGSRNIDSTIETIASGVWDARAQAQLADRDFAEIHPARLRFDLISLGAILRIDQREFVFRALGLLNLAWPISLLLLIPQIRTRRWLDAPLVFLLALNVLTILFWTTAEFNPASTVNTHASYAMIIIAFVTACIILFHVSPRWAWGVCLVNSVLSIVVWVLLAPGPFWPPKPRLSWIALLVASSGTAAIVQLLRSHVRQAGDTAVTS